MTQIAKWTTLGALFLIPFLPLYVAGDLFFPYITGKAFAFRILVELALAGWLFLAFVDKRYRPRFSAAMLVFAAFTLWMLVADSFGINAHKALWSNFERMDGWITLIHLFAFSFVLSSVLTVHDLWRKWWLTFLLGSAFICGYGLLQIAGVLQTHQGDRVDASFGNAAYLPAYLLFCVAIALWQAIVRKGWLRYLLLILAVLQSIVLLSSGTRGSFLGLAGAAVICALLWFVETKGAGRRAVIGVLVGVVILVGGLFALRSTAFVEGNQTLSRLASSFSVESLETRFAIWNMALKGAADRPIAGWGQEGFNYVFAKYYEPSLFAQEPWFDRAHNVFLDWLIAGGVPALALFLVMLAAIVVSLYRGPFTSLERVLITGALAGYAIQGLAVFDNLFTYVPLFAILAFVHARAASPIETIERFPELKTPPKRVALGAATLVLAALAIWFVNVPNIQAGRYLIRALQIDPPTLESAEYFRKALSQNSFAAQEIREHLVSFSASAARRPDVSDDVKRELLSLAFLEMETYIARYPTDPRLHLHIASAYTAIGEYGRALAHIDDALRLSPQKQTSWIQRGTLLWDAGEAEAALEAFRHAYELDPSFPVLAGYVAAGEVINGNTAAADAFLMDSFGTTTVDSEPLRTAYYQTKNYDKLLAIEELRVRNARGAPAARFGLAIVYAAIGRQEDAEAEIRATVAAFPETAAYGKLLLERIQATPQ